MTRTLQENHEWLMEAREEGNEVDISDGHLCRWWVFLGGTGKQRPLFNRGVTHVVASGRTLKLTLLDGRVFLSSSGHATVSLFELSAA